MKIKYSLIAAALLFSASVALAGTNGTAEENATAYEEARSRISPIIVDLNPSHNVRYCGFSAGQEYTITTTTMGYEKDMDTYITMYDCDGITAPGCGRRYSSSERVVDTDYIPSSDQSHQDWTYTDAAGTTVPAYVDVYVNTFTIPENGEDGNPWGANDGANGGHGGDQSVVRWWQKAADAEGKSVSLLIGVEATRHYGENMRRVGSLISSDLNASADNTACADNK